ncbi:hypothetical protein HPB50_003102 [Hyalomma asiaticum]|uniref:Uncharacterized protein n=1 Tax=Hyalomma asiaticum TaxID=266040 RepID=A0ACB7TC87_HYAAI|nr:hypothetical protein HPB50_003102 [Hyalomma asiaticum]
MKMAAALSRSLRSPRQPKENRQTDPSSEARQTHVSSTPKTDVGKGRSGQPRKIPPDETPSRKEDVRRRLVSSEDDTTVYSADSGDSSDNSFEVVMTRRGEEEAPQSVIPFK